MCVFIFITIPFYFNSFAISSSLESVGLKATIVMPILLLQKPFQASKPKDLKKCLDRRLEFWKNGNLESLMEEGIEIQNRLHKSRSSFAVKDLQRLFTNLMFQDKIKQAIRLICDNDKGNILHINDHLDPLDPISPTVKELIKDKHPSPMQVDPSYITTTNPPPFHPVLLRSLMVDQLK